MKQPGFNGKYPRFFFRGSDVAGVGVTLKKKLPSSLGESLPTSRRGIPRVCHLVSFLLDVFHENSSKKLRFF